MQCPFGKAGWYPSDEKILRKRLSSYLLNTFQESQVSAIIAPHAGYSYCGSILGHAFGATQNQKINHIIIIGPSHYEYLNNEFHVPKHTVMSTEIGESKINQSFINQIKRIKNSKKKETLFKKEHSIWMMLPFIQTLHPDAEISPMIIGDITFEMVQELSDQIKANQDENTLLVISSDFTHYGTAFNYTPFIGHIPNEIKKFDQLAFEFIKTKNSKGFWHWFHENETTICGRYAISILLETLNHEKLITSQYLQSGELNENWAHSVSYQSAVFSQ